MTRRTDCERYPKCLSSAAHFDAEVRCDLCPNYAPTDPHPSTRDLAGILALILAVTNPDLESRLPPDRQWKWDLLQIFTSVNHGEHAIAINERNFFQ